VGFELDRGLRAAGRLLDSKGRPLANRWLIVRSESGLALPIYPRTDEKGRFERSGLPQGRIVVEMIDGKQWPCGSFLAGTRDVELRVEKQ